MVWLAWDVSAPRMVARDPKMSPRSSAAPALLELSLLSTFTWAWVLTLRLPVLAS